MQGQRQEQGQKQEETRQRTRESLKGISRSDKGQKIGREGGGTGAVRATTRRTKARAMIIMRL